jgi:hypothetical protein
VVILGFFFGTVDTGAIVAVSSSNVRRPRVRGGSIGWDCSAAAAAVRRFDTEDVDEDGRDGAGFFGWVVAT